MHISYPILTLFLGCGEEEAQQDNFKNLPPFSPIIEIVPEKDGEERSEADTTTDLRVKLYPEAVMPEDPEGDNVTVSYVWLVDGELAGLDGELITAEDTAKGQTWQVYAYANDGSLDSAPAIREVTIQNAKPQIIDISKTPDNPTTTDDLTVEVNSTTDDDGDEVTLSYAWLKDGETQDEYTENTLPSTATAKEEQWIVQITPNDGTTSGPIQEEVFTIENTPSTISSVSLPDDSTKAAGITATVTAEDVDEDELTYNFMWYVNTNEIADATSETLDPTYFIKGDEIQVTVTANDGDDDSEPISSDVITVKNTAPVISTVTITDSITGDSDTITRDSTALCTTESSDIDEVDTIETSYSWSVNGIEIGTGSELALSTTTIATDDTLVCTTIANDGSDDSESMESSVVITNASLTLSSVTLASEAGYIETIQPVYTFNDADNNASRTFTWYKGSDVTSGTLLPVSSQESINLNELYSNGDIVLDDTIFVVITLSDEDTTLEETSSLLTIIDVDLDDDGVFSATDCDDDDDTLFDFANDEDCDGISKFDIDGTTFLDCDDQDSEVINTTEFDADCDLVSTDLDCDDNDSAQGAIADDLDCDEILNTDDDDDDGDGALEFDTDGITIIDCDDTDPNLGDITLDEDCDSVLSDSDVDDTDPASDSDTDGQSDLDEYTCASDPLDNTSLYDDTDSDENGTADCLE
jgi:hypothetical protein